MALNPQQIATRLLDTANRIDGAEQAFAQVLTDMAAEIRELLDANDLTAVEAALTRVEEEAEQIAAAAVRPV